MSTFIALDDGRTWWASNWGYDAVIEAIAQELTQTEAERELATWLQEQTCLVCGPGLGSIDVRELTPQNRQDFRSAAQRAFRSCILIGSRGWHDPSFFPVWLQGFRRLLRMWKAIDRRESPGLLKDCPEPLEFSHHRSGPGWEEVPEEFNENPQPPTT